MVTTTTPIPRKSPMLEPPQSTLYLSLEDRSSGLQPPLSLVSLDASCSVDTFRHMMNSTAAQMRLNSIVQGKRKGPLSVTSWLEISVESIDARAKHLVQDGPMAPSGRQLRDVQAVGVSHMDQVVIL
jgi:hypothetical protein